MKLHHIMWTATAFSLMRLIIGTDGSSDARGEHFVIFFAIALVSFLAGCFLKAHADDVAEGHTSTRDVGIVYLITALFMNATTVVGVIVVLLIMLFS